MAKEVLYILHATYPNLKHYLNFSNTLELLVATMLSAQVRDEKVNAVTPALFSKYRKAADYAQANVKEIAEMIKSITYANAKAKNIIQACKVIEEKHNGKVPANMEALVELPGIGRKSANAILQNGFNIVEGIVVDTHVLRVTYGLGWTSSTKNAEKAEKELMSIPKNEWINIPKLMKAHGRAICKAPIPECSRCPVEKLCQKKGVIKHL